jgi:hypothetical protein
VQERWLKIHQRRGYNHVQENTRDTRNPDHYERVDKSYRFWNLRNNHIEAAGRYITIDTSQASIPKGLGTRHASVAGITQETPAVGIVLSQSGGKISLFKDGRIFRVITVKE